MKNKRILLAVSEYGEFHALFDICSSLVGELDVHPVFVFSAGYGKLREHSQLVESRSWSWGYLGGSSSSYFGDEDERSDGGYIPVSPKHKEGISEVGFLKRFIGTIFFVFYFSRVVERFFKRGRAASEIYSRYAGVRIKRELARAEHIFSKTNPVLILSGQDYVLSVTCFLSLVGERNNVKTIIIPYSMPPTTRELIESFSYLGLNKLGRVEKKLASLISPAWLNFRRGDVYSRVNLASALLSDKLGLTPPLPWLPNSGRGIIFAPSLQGYNYYLRAGVPASQLYLAGALWSDQLVRQRATVLSRKVKLLARVNAFLRSLGKRHTHTADILKDNSNLLVVSWVPNQWPRKAVGYDSYDDLNNAFISLVAYIQSSGLASIAVSLHPTLSSVDFISALNKAGIYVVHSSLIDFVDCADVFVSTVSSTAFWALQEGIPSINFDGYLYGYTEFSDAGAITVSTPLKLVEACEKIFSDNLYRDSVRRSIHERSGEYSYSDGCSMARIFEGISKYMR